jgi:hypothetical protein
MLPYLIEDEILLALPTAPRHDDCVLPGGVGKESAIVSPFSVLAGLHGKASVNLILGVPYGCSTEQEIPVQAWHASCA